MSVAAALKIPGDDGLFVAAFVWIALVAGNVASGVARFRDMLKEVAIDAASRRR